MNNIALRIRTHYVYNSKNQSKLPPTVQKGTYRILEDNELLAFFVYTAGYIYSVH